MSGICNLERNRDAVYTALPSSKLNCCDQCYRCIYCLPTSSSLQYLGKEKIFFSLTLYCPEELR